MKKKLLLLTLITSSFVFNLFAQNNPVQNLTWSQWYESPNNFFQLSWEEPAQPHDELIGYNIYRNYELYRFQMETFLFTTRDEITGAITSNCNGIDFLLTEPVGPFEIHVTAVYNPGAIESNYVQTAFSMGPALNHSTFENKRILIYPNPTTGMVSIGNKNVEKMIVYDISGKVIREFTPTPQIDLSDLSKGVYILKLFSERNIFVDKIVIQ